MDFDFLNALPEFTLPTHEQLQKSAEDWWKIHAKINFLEWNNVLKENSYPLYSFKISPDLIKNALEHNGTQEITSVFEREIEASGYAGSFFLKLITRSPKDYLDGESFELKNAREAVDAVFGSLRCFDDLCQLYLLDKCIFILRPFMQIPKEREFRIFVEDGRIKGISQYHYLEKFYWIGENAINIENRIRNFIEEICIPNVGLSSFVADVVLKDEREVLLELNAYGLSDPCLFEKYDNLKNKFLWIQ